MEPQLFVRVGKTWKRVRHMFFSLHRRCGQGPLSKGHGGTGLTHFPESFTGAAYLDTR